MNRHGQTSESEPADAEIELLLRAVGRRDEPASDCRDAVREKVHAEWLAVVAERRRRKQWMISGIAAGFAVVALGTTLLMKQIAAPAPASIATIAHVHSNSAAGVVQVSMGRDVWRDIAPGEPLVAGAALRTDAARVVVQFDNGLSMRIDGGSLVRLSAVDRALLSRGRIYIDAPETGSAPLIVETRFGSVTHEGTQYQTELDGERFIVSVREGRVAISGKLGEWRLLPSDRMVIDASGRTVRDRIPTHGVLWTWAEHTAPPFDIDNRTLASFLSWVAREMGRELRYATSEARARAEQLVLRGSTAGLPPDRALMAVIATTDFKATAHSGFIDIHLAD